MADEQFRVEWAQKLTYLNDIFADTAKSEDEVFVILNQR
jgi:hypothetical protein